MAGRAGKGPPASPEGFSRGRATMLQLGKLPPPRPEPMGALNNESEYYQKDRRLIMEAFAVAYEKHGLQSKALVESGLNYDTFHRWLKLDAWFQTRMTEAQQVRRDHYESLVDQRLEDPVGNRGSDVLLMFKAKGEWPEKYGDRIKVEDPRLDRLLDIMARQRRLALDASGLAQGVIVEGEANPSLTEGRGREELPEPEEAG